MPRVKRSWYNIFNMILAVIVIWLLALAGCVWLFVVSVKLMIRGFQRAFGGTPQANGPPRGPPQDGHTMPAATATARPAVAPWVVALVTDHLRGCATCRAAVEGYRQGQAIPVIPLADLLRSLEPTTVSRMLAVIEAEDAAVAP